MSRKKPTAEELKKQARRDRAKARREKAVKAQSPAPEVRRRRIPDEAVAQSAAKPTKGDFRANSFQLPEFPKAAIPRAKSDQLAQDKQIIEVNAWAVQNTIGGAFANGIGFLGYPYLAELSQIPEYRKIVETTATHMTRKWIKLQASGDEGAEKGDKIKEIEDDIKRFKLQDVFRKASEIDGYFGRAHLYIDMGLPMNSKELGYSIGDGRDDLSRLKFKRKKNFLEGFKIIEPVWTYPTNYNSNDPLTGDWYNPQTWFVLGTPIHQTRLLRMVSHEVSDLLKPSYAFGGLSMTQMAKPYVDNWLRTRQSVADTVWSFSTSGMKTDLQTLMQSQGADLFARADLYNNLRNNRGLMLLNKDSEDFFQVNTPLGTLDKLLAMAQEQMASISSIPLVFLLGITPTGLNASSEGEIRAFYDYIHAVQERFFKEPLTRCIDFIQLSRYGFVDPEITFEFEPLWSLDEKGQAEVDKIMAETDDLRINGGIISPLEARTHLADRADSPYPGLDLSVIPVPPGETDDQVEEGENPDIGGAGLDPGRPRGEHDGAQNTDQLGTDEAQWQESKHPRSPNGQFGTGSGSSSAKPKNMLHHHVENTLKKPAGISGKYRQGIQDLLKDPNVSDEHKLKLKQKMIESYAAKHAQLVKANLDPEKQKSILNKLKKLTASLGTSMPATASAPVKEAPKETPKEMPTPQAGKHSIDKSHAQPDKFIVKTPQGTPIGNNGEPTQGGPTMKFNSQAEAEAYAEKLDKEYPEKQKQLEELKKKQQEAAEKAKQEQLKELEAITGTPEAKKHFDVLSGILGGNATNYIKEAANRAKKAGLDITPTEAAMIRAYSESHYGPLNNQMREGVMTKEQWGFAKALNKALDKLPKYEGTTMRGASLPAEVFAKYKPGFIIEERAFTSTGKGKKFGGNYSYTIEGHSGRDIQKLSSHSGENEVLFKSGSRFEVVSVSGNHIKLKEVDYE
jgi:phage-related protein (TIGR01555 family)